MYLPDDEAGNGSYCCGPGAGAAVPPVVVVGAPCCAPPKLPVVDVTVNGFSWRLFTRDSTGTDGLG